MVTKVSGFIIILYVLFSCSSKLEEQENKTNSNHFEVKNYEASTFTKKVEKFLRSKSLLSGTNHFIVILNFSECAQCVQDQFTSNLNKFINSDYEFLVLTDDSTILNNNNLKDSNSNIGIKIFNRDVFKSHQIFHSNPYIYKVEDDELIEGERLNSGWFEKYDS